MLKENIDYKIRSVYTEAAGNISVPDSVKDRINQKIADMEKVHHITRIKYSRIVLAAVIVLVFGSIASFAAGKASYIIGESTQEVDLTNFNDLPKVEKKVGYDIQAVEEFSNGYTFRQAWTGINHVYDEDGQMTGEKYTDLSLDYRNGANLVSLRIERERGQIASLEQPVEIKEIYGRTVYMTEYILKMVPEDYELTDEDWKLIEAGNFNVSCDGVTIGNVYFRTLWWENDGKIYSLTDTGQGLSFEEMEQMVSELLK